ncbi:MAG: hypothetical protein KBA11_10310, partial [Sedimentibacter sp.]|nr:hypothetical protein [Sedimentibacter sp.]
MKRNISILCLILLISTCFIIGTYGAINDSEILLDRTSYQGYGCRPIVTLRDNKLNNNPKVREIINVTVYSGSDTAGITVKLTETSADSAEFTGDFGVGTKSDDTSKTLQVIHDDTITVTYEGGLTYCADWRAYSGSVQFVRSSYTGLNSKSTIIITDKDHNIRSGYIDTATVRLTSDTDPYGIQLTAYETGANTGTFYAGFGFSAEKSSIRDAVIKVNGADNIYATYIDKLDENGAVNTKVTAAAEFKFSEAVIKTSASKDEGAGSMFTVTIDDPDANHPGIKDRIIAKVSSVKASEEKTIWLTETGENTGSFRCAVLLSDEITTATYLQVAYVDTINIKYIDNTVPDGSSKEVVKSINWTYIGRVLKTDKQEYSGFNSSARVTLSDYKLNTDEEKAETIDVKVKNTDSKGITLTLKETGSNTGEFTGILYFGKSTKASTDTIKVDGYEIITITYTNKKDKDDIEECVLIWSYQDAEIELDKLEYKGNNMPVNITLRDWDAGEKPKAKDEIKVTVKAPGVEKEVFVTLTETSNESGIFKGTFYINGSGNNKPSVTLNAGEKFKVAFTDKYTKSGRVEEKIAFAEWGGISAATLTLDSQKYIGCEDPMVIKLQDDDLNIDSNSKDKVSVQVRAKSGKTVAMYTLTESGTSNGEFIGVFKISDEPYTSKTIC